MSRASIPPRPGHAQSGTSVLRQRLAEALDKALQTRTHREVAEIIGSAVSTPHRRGADMTVWPASDFLSLAVADSDLREAIGEFLWGPEYAKGDAARAVPDLHLLLAIEGEIMSKVSHALLGGSVKRGEAGALLDAIGQRRRHEDDYLIPDLRVIARGDS